MPLNHRTAKVAHNYLDKSIPSGLSLLLLCALSGCVRGISASKYNRQEQCWGPKETVGRDVGFSGCDGAAVLATDSDGNYWRFNSSCIADGFRPVEDANVEAELSQDPSCNE